MFGINNYYNRKKLEIDIKIEEYRNTRMKEIQDLALKCADQKGEYEHEWHSRMETLKVEIAKLEALKETTANDVTTYKLLLEEKGKEVDRLNAIILKMAEQKVVISK